MQKIKRELLIAIPFKTKALKGIAVFRLVS